MRPVRGASLVCSMHPFSELTHYAVTFTLKTLSRAQEAAIDELQVSARTPLIKALQAMQMQKAATAVGIVSLFEAAIQDAFHCRESYREAEEILERQGDVELRGRLSDLLLAINALKHGRGRSHQALAAKADGLPFRVLRSDEEYFNEGEISEIRTLIKVDDDFLRDCVDVIRPVAEALRKVDPACRL